MAKYIKKPVTVDAIEWDGGNIDEVREFLGEDYAGSWGQRHPGGAVTVEVRTLEGIRPAFRGDFLIRGTKGEHYPCKPDIFKATYFEVENELH